MDSLGSVLAAVADGLAGRHAADDQRGQGCPSRPADEVWRALPVEQRKLMPVAAWLWKTGTRDAQAILFLIQCAVKCGARNLYSYLSPGGPARTNLLQQFSRAKAREGCR